MIYTKRVAIQNQEQQSKLEKLVYDYEVTRSLIHSLLEASFLTSGKKIQFLKEIDLADQVLEKACEQTMKVEKDISNVTYKKSSHVASLVKRRLRKKTQRLPRKAVLTMKKWLSTHSYHPYPSHQEKLELAQAGGISVDQVSRNFLIWSHPLDSKVQNWFINTRGKLERDSYVKNLFRKEIGAKLLNLSGKNEIQVASEDKNNVTKS
jgi:hypothetical protein